MDYLMTGLQNVDLLSVGVAVAAMTIFGFTVLFNNPKSASNQIFFYFAIIAGVWGVVNYVANQPHAPLVSLWLTRSVMFFGALASFLTFTFAYIFPSNMVKFPLYYRWILVPFTAVTLTLTMTPAVFSHIAEFTADGRVARIIIGPGILIFAVMAVFLNLGGITILVRKVIRPNDGQRGSAQIVLAGLTIMLILIVVFNFILPAFFDNPRFIPLGGVFLFPFIAFTSYAILKHKLFNIKIAGTAVLVFILSIATFLEVTFARDLAFIIYRSSVLILVLAFGVLLIRSVRREVEQREKLEVLSKELAEVNTELKKLDQIKSDFISIAGHQLRAPLTVIKGYVSMTLEGSFGVITEKARGAFEKVFISTNQLVKLIGDMLNLSRIESGKIQYLFTSSNIVMIIAGVVEEFKPEAKKKGLSITFRNRVGKSLIMRHDPDKIREAIVNLVHNAIKYADKGRITVALEEVGSEDKKLRISVSDQGLGIKAEDLDRLFTKFARTEDARKFDPNGLGIGLYFVKRVVEDHGGTARAESEGLGKGSTFIVELPMKR